MMSWDRNVSLTQRESVRGSAEVGQVEVFSAWFLSDEDQLDAISMVGLMAQQMVARVAAATAPPAPFPVAAARLNVL